jgi:hypothetical protein
MNPPLADTVIPGGGLFVEIGPPHPGLIKMGWVYVPPVTLVILTMGFAPGVPPE